MKKYTLIFVIKGNFTSLLIDDAVLQMSYEFKGNTLRKHRLSFFPSPSLEFFQNQPEIYEEDQMYGNIVQPNTVPFPIRFDFDVEAHSVVQHPKSHLTLGQYKNCRIPVCYAITPISFIKFILQNFYNSPQNDYTLGLSKEGKTFEIDIDPLERKLLHMNCD